MPQHVIERRHEYASMPNYEVDECGTCLSVVRRKSIFPFTEWTRAPPLT